MLILWGSVTRGTLWGGVLGPEEGLDREQALRTLTINAAYASFWEDGLGSIETGKYADLVVLSEDYLTVPEDATKTSRSWSPWSGVRSPTAVSVNKLMSPRSHAP